MRQAKPKHERRERMIGVHVTDAEYEILRTLAFKAKVSVATYVRDRVLPPKK